MPVLIVRADGLLGRRLTARLIETGGEVRAVCTAGGEASLREVGAVAAAGDALDTGRLEAAMEQVHTVVHLDLGVESVGPEQLIQEAAAVTAAATGARVRRLVVLSVPGAGGSDPLRAAKGEVEALAAAAPLPSVAIRFSMIDTPRLTSSLVKADLDKSSLGQRVAPVRLDDAVELLATIDSLRGHAEEGHAVLAADGPETMPFSKYLTLREPNDLTDEVSEAPMLVPSLANPWVSGLDVPSAWTLCETSPRRLA